MPTGMGSCSLPDSLMIYLMIYLQARSPVAEMKELIAALLGVLALYIPVGK